MTAHAPHFGCLWLVCGLLAGPASAPASTLSNQEFASQVRQWRGQMQRNEQAVGDASLLCAYLPEHRAVEEPQCVALRGHFRNHARDRAGKDGKLGQLPSAERSLAGQLADLLSRALPQG